MPGYGTDLGLAEYADARGLTVPSGNVTAARVRGSDYIDGMYGDRFPGVPAAGFAQERAWPRVGAADSYGGLIAADVIPERVVWASYEAALYEMANPAGLAPVVTPGQLVIREKVGPLEVEYADAAATTGVVGSVPVLASVEGLLRPLLQPAYGPAVLVV